MDCRKTTVHISREFHIVLQGPEIFSVKSNQDFCKEGCKHVRLKCNVLSAEPIIILIDQEQRQLPNQVLEANRTRLHGPGTWMEQVLKVCHFEMPLNNKNVTH